MAFKIADAYVEIHAQLANNEFKKISQRLLTVLPIVGTLASYAGGLAAVLVSLASSLAQASIASAALIPLGVALGSVFGVARLIFKDMAEGPLKNVHKGLKDMEASLTKIAIEAAKPGLERLLQAANKLMPMVSDHIRHIATSFSQVSIYIAQLMEQPFFRGRLNELLDGSALAARKLMFSIRDVLDMFVGVGAAAVPILMRIVDWLTAVLYKWADWVRLKSQTGELFDLFSDASNEAANWAKIVGNFIWGLVGILDAVSVSGGRMSRSMLDISESFRTWAWDPEVQGKIQGLVEFFLNIDYEELTKTAASIVSIGLALRTLTGASAAVSGLMAFISLGPVAIIIGILAFQLAILAGALVYAYLHSEAFRAKVGELAEWVNATVIPALKDMWHWLEEKIVPAWNKASEESLPKLIEWMNILKRSWEENKDQLIPLWEKLKQVIDFIITQGIPFVMALGIALSTNLVNGIVFAVSILNGLNRMLESTGSVIEGLENTVHGLADGMARAWDWIKRTVSDAAGAIGREVSNINRLFQSIKVPSIPNPFGGFGGLFGRAHGGIVGAASGGMRGGHVLVGEAGPELVRLPPGSRVRTNPDTERMLGSGGGVTVVNNWYVQGSIVSDRDIIKLVRDEHANLGFGV